MKKTVLSTLLMVGLVACKKQEETTTKTLQQLLVGTWTETKTVEKQTATDGTLIKHDSTSYPVATSPFVITYKADGTTFSPGAITANYSYVPPLLAYTYNGIPYGTDFTNTVLQLTEHKLVVYSKKVINTLLLEYKNTYER